jgi:transposase
MSYSGLQIGEIRASATLSPRALSVAEGLSLIRKNTAILQNEEDLNDQEKAKLEKIQQELEHLAKMQRLREEIRDIFENEETLGMGTIKLADWLKQAQDFYKNSCKSITNWFGEIVGYFENRTTNGLVEEINNKLKLIKRRGYGFTNVKNFELRCLMSWYFIAGLSQS